MKARCTRALLGFLLCPLLAPAQTISKANTVEISDSPFSQHPLGARVLNEPCSFGSQYHYQINELGELRVEGKVTCGSLRNTQGGQLICHLNSELRCTGSSPAVLYAITRSGIAAGDGRTTSWANPENARALFPLIEHRAEQKCENVLQWEATDKAHMRESPSPTRVQEQENCRPTLQKYCAGSNGGPVRLKSGKDIRILCQQ
jgi:hypothetical protein